MTPEVRDFALREIGCVPCRLKLGKYVPAEKHHLLTTGMHGNGKRRGEAFTVAACPWHHRGLHPYHMTPGQARSMFGPSYAREPKAFREEWPDDVLLAEQNRLIDVWRKSIVTGENP